MRSRTPRIFWLPILACCAFAACTQIENPGTVVPGSPSVEDTQSRCLQRVQFEDVPIPWGFEYVTRGNRSFSYEGGGVRAGRFEYWGRTPLQETAAFFKETLVLRAYGWQLVSEDDDPRERSTTLKFRKRNQNCEIKIRQEAGDTRIYVLVTGMDET